MKVKKVEVLILDAPGINGMGDNSYERFKKYTEEGGKIWHSQIIEVPEDFDLADITIKNSGK